jgi:hypothetical protein
MDSFIEREIKEKHNQADAFISLFFAGLDAVCYLIIITLFGCEFKLNSPKQKLSLLIILDAVLRLINMYTDEYSKYWLKEMFLSTFSTIQFYVILSCLNQIFTDKGNDNSLENDLEIKNKTLITCIFFALVFSFKGLLLYYRLLSALQYICIIASVYIFSKYIGTKIEIFISNITKKHSSFIGENFMNNLPFFITIYFILNYSFELISLLIVHKLYASYMIMLCKIFKEVGKYLIFLLLIIINHSFNKYIQNYDFGFSSSGMNEIKTKDKDNERARVNIYKDEDEYDDA